MPDLLSRILDERRKAWNGRGRYKEPLVANTTSLPHLPDGWNWASLDQLFLNITDGDHQPPPQTSAGVPFVVIGDVRTGKLDLSDTRFVSHEYAGAVDQFRKPRKGDVLYTLVGSFGLALRVTTDDAFCIQRHIAVLRPHSLSPADFLGYVLNCPAVFQNASAVATGTAQKTVPLAGLRRIPVPLPPLPEQRRIVAEIEKQFTRLEAGVAALRRVQANLKRYRAAVLKAACEGQLVPTEAELSRSQPSTKNPQPAYEPASKLLVRILAERRKNWTGRGKYKEPAAPDTANLPPLPEGWTWARLEQLGFPIGGLTKNPKRAKFKKQLPYLRVANVYANELRLQEMETIGVEDSELEKLLVRAGDLLIVEGNGSKDQIGRSAIWDGSIDPCVHQNHIIKVRPVESRMPKWIQNWLQSPVGRLFVELVASSTSGLYTLSVGKVGDLLIALPPLAEQTRIVAEVERRLSVVEELESVVSANLQRATRLRQSILQKAFTGEL